MAHVMFLAAINARVLGGWFCRMTNPRYQGLPLAGYCSSAIGPFWA